MPVGRSHGEAGRLAGWGFTFFFLYTVTFVGRLHARRVGEGVFVACTRRRDDGSECKKKKADHKQTDRHTGAKTDL